MKNSQRVKPNQMITMKKRSMWPIGMCRRRSSTPDMDNPIGLCVETTTVTCESVLCQVVESAACLGLGGHDSVEPGDRRDVCERFLLDGLAGVIVVLVHAGDGVMGEWLDLAAGVLVFFFFKQKTAYEITR